MGSAISKFWDGNARGRNTPTAPDNQATKSNEPQSKSSKSRTEAKTIDEAPPRPTAPKPHEPKTYLTTFETTIVAPREESFNETDSLPYIDIDADIVDHEGDLPFGQQVEDAVIKIQAGVRGYLARKQLSKSRTPEPEARVFEPIVPPPTDFSDNRVVQVERTLVPQAIVAEAVTIVSQEPTPEPPVFVKELEETRFKVEKTAEEVAKQIESQLASSTEAIKHAYHDFEASKDKTLAEASNKFEEVKEEVLHAVESISANKTLAEASHKFDEAKEGVRHFVESHSDAPKEAFLNLEHKFEEAIKSIESPTLKRAVKEPEKFIGAHPDFVASALDYASKASDPVLEQLRTSATSPTDSELEEDAIKLLSGVTGGHANDSDITIIKTVTQITEIDADSYRDQELLVNQLIKSLGNDDDDYSDELANVQPIFVDLEDGSDDHELIEGHGEGDAQAAVKIQAAFRGYMTRKNISARVTPTPPEEF